MQEPLSPGSSSPRRMEPAGASGGGHGGREDVDGLLGFGEMLWLLGVSGKRGRCRAEARWGCPAEDRRAGTWPGLAEVLEGSLTLCIT